VKNATPSAGNWDFKLTWQTAGPESLFAALKEHLGLELAEQTGSQEYLIVDRIEMPALLAGTASAAWEAIRREK